MNEGIQKSLPLLVRIKSIERCFKFFVLACLIFYTSSPKAQQIHPDLLQKQWRAKWITVPGTSATGYGVYLFRKHLELASLPKTFPVHLSADNRYKLFVNERLVSLGPVRGDLTHWNFETVDLAPYLQVGQNIIAAQVWNEGEWRQEAQISLRTAFILQGGTTESEALNTEASWRCVQDSSYQPIPITLPTYYAAGPGEQVEMKCQYKGWNSATYNDNAWKSAQVLFAGTPKYLAGPYGSLNGWMLLPSSLPMMELKEQRLAEVKRSERVSVPSSFPAQKSTIIVPANTVATLLLDQSYLTNAYPTLVFSGGNGSTLSITYAEALYTKFPSKGNRNEIAGKYIMGRKDSVLSDGSKNQQFTTLSWRTYRYLQIRITTKEEPLSLDNIYGTFVGYPFPLNAKLQTDNNELQQMFEIGWRTARLCAVETYMDCPYYEQLQYVGDTRIQGLISLYNSGDDRLLRNALNQIDQSRRPEGLTLSRYPTANAQYIPPFSLWYIGMLHDYMMYGNDTLFIKNKLGGARQILDYFSHYQQADGSLNNVPYWTFTDWVTTTGWKQGVAPVGKYGTSALLDLQLLWAYQLAADMEGKIGVKALASLYQERATSLKNMIRNKYWDANKKLFADRSEKDLFSQHANSLAILTGLVSGDEGSQI